MNITIIILIIVIIIVIIITVGFLIYYYQKGNYTVKLENNLIQPQDLENNLIKLQDLENNLIQSKNIKTFLTNEEISKLPTKKPIMTKISIPEHKNIYYPKSYKLIINGKIKNGKFDKRWKGQRAAKQVFEEYLIKNKLSSFLYTNIKPNFLKNPLTKCNLEYDIYEPVRKIAIEYNGIQHYFPGFFGMNQEKFIEAVNRDYMKYQLGSINGDIIINIPFYIDVAKLNSNGTYTYLNNVKYEDRKRKIKEYLYPILDNIYFGII